MPSQPPAPIPPRIIEPARIDDPPKESTKRLPVAITEEMDQVERSTMPQHSGKSNFPTIAKVFGRWTTGGGFKRQSQLDAQDDEGLVPPKDPMIRNVALLVIVAVLSFSLVMFLLRLPACQDDYGKISVPPQAAQVAPPASPVGKPEPPRPAPVRTAPPPSPSASDIATVKASLRPPAQAAVPKPEAPKPAAPARAKKPTTPTPTRQPAGYGRPDPHDRGDDLMPMRL
jgi:hypothetical protein